MQKVTRILNAIERGDTEAVEKLLPVVYEELRQMAAKKMAQEKPGLLRQGVNRFAVTWRTVCGAHLSHQRPEFCQ